MGDRGSKSDIKVK